MVIVRRMPMKTTRTVFPNNPGPHRLFIPVIFDLLRIPKDKIIFLSSHMKNPQFTVRKKRKKNRL